MVLTTLTLHKIAYSPDNLPRLAQRLNTTMCAAGYLPSWRSEEARPPGQLTGPWPHGEQRHCRCRLLTLQMPKASQSVWQRMWTRGNENADADPSPNWARLMGVLRPRPEQKTRLRIPLIMLARSNFSRQNVIFVCLTLPTITDARVRLGPRSPLGGRGRPGPSAITLPPPSQLKASWSPVSASAPHNSCLACRTSAHAYYSQAVSQASWR